MRRFKTIDETLDAIYSYVDYSMTHVKETDAAVFSLEKVRELLRRLGNPEARFRSIHVAGTKGKGSVCAMLTAGLTQAGFRTGFYSSPHLVRFNERFQIGFTEISDERLIDITNKVFEVLDDTFRPSTFDLMTAISFVYFSEEAVDFAVVETGLGGRLDSTNVLNPILTVITSISLDHTAFLGNTIEAIADEKGGILKPNVPAILAPERPEAMTVLQARAVDLNAPTVDVARSYERTVLHDTTMGQTLRITRADGLSRKFELNLSGANQAQNAAIALAALDQLHADGFIADVERCLAGFKAVAWPCRFEVRRIADGRVILLDGAHNADSIDKLVNSVRTYFPAARAAYVVGFSEDKELRPMIERIARDAAAMIATRSTHPRAASADLIAEMSRAYGVEVTVCGSAVHGLEDALAAIHAMTGIDVFVVTGSLFVAGGIRALVMNEEMKTDAADEPWERK